MSENVIVIGAGGHAKVVADIILLRGDRLLGFLDDDITKKSIHGYPVLGTIASAISHPEASFVIAIGDNEIRRQIAHSMSLRWYTAIHPTAVIAPSAKVGRGSMVMPLAVVHSDAVVGDHSIINTASVVEHDDVIADFVHISSGVALGGTVRIDELSQIGIGSCVKHGVHICANCIIGAGAAVVSDVSEPGTYIGIPAHLLHKH